MYFSQWLGEEDTFIISNLFTVHSLVNVAFLQIKDCKGQSNVAHIIEKA